MASRKSAGQQIRNEKSFSLRKSRSEMWTDCREWSVLERPFLSQTQEDV
ncbi:MAG: hypothetical protein RH862_09810 [Leptospiraceae bacterium]